MSNDQEGLGMQLSTPAIRTRRQASVGPMCAWHITQLTTWCRRPYRLQVQSQEGGAGHARGHEGAVSYRYPRSCCQHANRLLRRTYFPKAQG